jgi:sec-independent protein translocase protein TatC
MSVLDHLRELRRRLIVIFVIIAAGAIVGWVAYEPILEVLKHPYCRLPYEHRLGALSQKDCKLLFRGPLDGFTIRLKVSFLAGAIMTGPLWLFQVWRFVTPGLRRNERRWTILFVLTSTVLFFAGMALAYVTLSKGLQVLVISAGSGTQAALDVNSYLSFVTLMLVIFGASFELPLLIVMLNAVRVLPYTLLKKGQRLAIFLIFVFAAASTPSTDPFTMIAMAVPVCLLFEASVLWAFVHDKRRAKRLLAEEIAELPDDVASDINPYPEGLPEPADDDNAAPDWTKLP